MSSQTHNEILDQVLDPLAQCFTPEVAERIAALRAPEGVQQRIDELAERSTSGTLTNEERAEYETWVRAVNLLGILQSKARRYMTMNDAA